MASQKHLKDLLQEDQEPFHLNTYISDKKYRIKRPRTDLQTKTRKSITQDARFRSSFCRNACFFSLNQSPDPRKSPLFDFKSPNKNPNSFDIPSRTAAVLLEAGVRVRPTVKTQNRGNAFGLFGSMLKKFKQRRKREIRGDGVKVSVKDILTSDSPIVQQRFNGNIKREKIETAFETRLSCSCNEEACLDSDFETSASSESDGFYEIDEFACESPFRFVLQTSSPGRRTPDFRSPAASPSRSRTENSDDNEVESLKKLGKEEDEEDKEQCSPVSVLETPFEDDNDDHHDDDDDVEQRFHLKPTLLEVTRRSANNRLLQKLCRFDELTGLDPIELEKRVSEEEHGNGHFNHHKQETEAMVFVQTILKSAFSKTNRVPEGMERLVYDLVAEEEEENQESEETMAKRVCRRLDSWREVESNTIDMMVEHDFRQEQCLWTANHEEVEEVVVEIELAVLGYLIHELSYDLWSVRFSCKRSALEQTFFQTRNAKKKKLEVLDTRY